METTLVNDKAVTQVPANDSGIELKSRQLSEEEKVNDEKKDFIIGEYDDTE